MKFENEIIPLFDSLAYFWLLTLPLVVAHRKAGDKLVKLPSTLSSEGRVLQAQVKGTECSIIKIKTRQCLSDKGNVLWLVQNLLANYYFKGMVPKIQN